MYIWSGIQLLCKLEEIWESDYWVDHNVISLPAGCSFQGLLQFFWIQKHKLMCYLWEKFWWFGSKSCCTNCSSMFIFSQYETLFDFSCPFLACLAPKMQADSNYHSKALKLLMPQQEKYSELLFFFALAGSKLWTEEGNCGGKDQGCHQWLWTNWKEFHPLLAWEEGLSFGSCCHQWHGWYQAGSSPAEIWFHAWHFWCWCEGCWEWWHFYWWKGHQSGLRPQPIESAMGVSMSSSWWNILLTQFNYSISIDA